MNKKNNILPFLKALQKEGFPLGVDSYLRLARVWREIPDGTNPANIRDYLCPLVAQDEAGQERFRQLFPDYAHLLGLQWSQKSSSTFQPQKASAKTETTPIARPDRYRYLRWTLIAAAIIGALIWFFSPKPTEEQKKVETAIPEITDIIGCRDSTASNYNPRATVDCDNCCDYTKEEEVAEIPKVRLGLSELAKADTLSVPPSFTPITNKPLPRLDPIPDNALQWLSDYKRPVSFLLWGLLLVLSIGYYLWRRANRQYLARQDRADEPPYRLPIKIRRARPIALSDEFFLAVNRLRGRELGERRKLDVRKTVAATIQRGGFANFQYRTLTRPVEYLILIDKQADQHHQAQLFEYIYREIVRQEVYAERYFFDGDPRYCWNDQHPAGVPLERLLQRHSTSRLLILANGYSFINPASGQLEDWTKALAGWQQRALLSPAPTAGWNFREAVLARFFLLLPGNLQGLTQVVRHFEGLPTPGLRDWKYDLGREDHPIEPDEEHIVESLSGKLSPTLMRWLTACAVYPELHWDLTLELGAALSEPGEELVNFDNITQLSRLPWFRDGYMPGEVRAQLLHSTYLNDEDRLAVRAAIVSVLEANVPANTNSYAYEEHQLHLAINHTLLSRLPTERQEWVRRYRELHAKGVREDKVSMVELDRNFNTLLDFQLPQAFFPKGRRLLGVRSGIPVLLAAILALIVWGLGLFVPDPCGGTVAQLTPDAEEHYCLQSPEDSLAFFAREAIILADSLQLNSLLKRTAVVAELQPDTPAIARKDSLYYAPVQTHLWNMALAAYDTADYENAANIAGKLKELLEAEANDRINQQPGSTSMLDNPNEEKWSYHLRCLELLGRTAFFAKDRELAAQYAVQVSAKIGVFYAGLLPSPNLYTLLTYDFVDSLHLTRIRVRQGNRYGFLDEQGQPIWEEDQPPFDYAWNYREENGRIVALKIEGTMQCNVDLAGNDIRESCFTQLTPFQNSAGRYGYENENSFPVIPAQYVDAGAFTPDRLAWIKKEGEAGYGYIRFDGSDLLSQNNLEEAGDFHRGLAVVRKDGKYGYLDTQGEMAIPTQFDEAGDFNALGQAQVRRSERNYIIDRQGRCVSGNCPLKNYQAQISGTLNDNPGKILPVDGAQVRILRPDRNSILTTDILGWYYFQLPENIDPTSLRVFLEKEGFQPTSYQLEILDDSTDPIMMVNFMGFNEKPLADRDKDGVPDNADKCPDEAGPVNTEGCPDQDGDGITDLEDKCPDQYGHPSAGGCPDQDGDGITDVEDKCPNQYGLPSAGGCPDRDDDGIPDQEDLCPSLKGTTENSGCPSETIQKTYEHTVYFDYDRYDISSEEENKLEVFISNLIDKEILKSDVFGYADNTGTDVYNLRLSEERAKGVALFLVKNGITIDQIYMEGKAELDDNNSTAKNRRVEISIVCRESKK